MPEHILNKDPLDNNFQRTLGLVEKRESIMSRGNGGVALTTNAGFTITSGSILSGDTTNNK